MGVKYVIVEPDPPSWWTRNQLKVVIVTAVVAVLYLRGAADQGTADGPQHRPTPTPGVSRSATP
ncbi:hypothetical protein ACFPK5_00900 [Streptomyces beijiangensis]|uniref:hypothetical protein n=1 Tax=Streptomyces beijiangensis TaxID=163361 RepID=UPI0031D9046D